MIASICSTSMVSYCNSASAIALSLSSLASWAMPASITAPYRRPGAGHVFHQYVLRCENRAEVQAHFKAQGIGTGLHYPVPVHLQPAYKDRSPLGPAGCAETARAAEEVLSIPMYPELSEAQVERICAALRAL